MMAVAVSILGSPVVKPSDPVLTIHGWSNAAGILPSNTARAPGTCPFFNAPALFASFVYSFVFGKLALRMSASLFVSAIRDEKWLKLCTNFVALGADVRSRTKHSLHTGLLDFLKPCRYIILVGEVELTRMLFDVLPVHVRQYGVESHRLSHLKALWPISTWDTLGVDLATDD
ncbi:hypothetical protein HBI45_088660 [Parastagonospora nodorum]|nr:hypothetical protein HBI45_088660 [Parastagonospora nodorum]